MEQAIALDQHQKLTQKFCVSSLAEIPQGSQLVRILARISKEKKLNPVDQSYLNRFEMLAIADFALGKISHPDYVAAISQRSENKKVALAQRLDEEKKQFQAELAKKRKLAEEKAEALRQAEIKKAKELMRAEGKKISAFKLEASCLAMKDDVERRQTTFSSFEKYQESKNNDIASLNKYGFVDENPLQHARLLRIIKKIETNTSLFESDIQYLKSQGFFKLQEYAIGNINFEEYKAGKAQETIWKNEAIAIEAEHQRIKLKIAEEQRLADIKLAQERALAAKIAYDNDPINIVKAKQEKLKNKYGIFGFIEKDCFKKFINILNAVDAKTRLSDEDIIWLETTAKKYYTDELRKAYHYIEAQFHHDEFSKTKDSWSAVNASKHYRKSEQARAADTLLSSIDIDQEKDPKLKSAFCTTHGGVKRDLRLFRDALVLGDKAHLLTPQDIRPCTLLGAVNMEMGNYELGQSWYAKAVERGYTEKSVDDELKQIFKRADKEQKAALKAHLLKTDARRYCWVNPKK
ncbi:hypothetical protein [Chitinibacter sp. S2-10]|uniref:hypothetical protein n=1 Tax=Chitinibacter sp. S2-10 TaxID=3373597 RepID=UPI0039779919